MAMERQQQRSNAWAAAALKRMAFVAPPCFPYARTSYTSCYKNIPMAFAHNLSCQAHMDPKTASICSWCSRMKRGALYKCMAENGFNVLALGLCPQCQFMLTL
eukprot:4608477-Amphidinium_carterae.1